jgi:hypothetical protein
MDEEPSDGTEPRGAGVLRAMGRISGERMLGGGSERGTAEDAGARDDGSDGGGVVWRCS